MKNCIYLLAAALLSGSFAYCEQELDSTKQMKSQYHRIYAGPDVFIDHEKTSCPSSEARINTASTAVFGGLRVGYDYLKPRAFYFGAEGLVAMGRSVVKNDVELSSTCCSYRIKQRYKGSPLFANLEQRYGYTFQSPVSAKSTLTPFAGIGWYYTRPEFDNGNFSANWFYGAAGLRVNHQFYENFDVGFNFKAMYSFAGKQHVMVWSAPAKENIKHAWGYEVALPFTWHVGTQKKWDLQFQPYLLKLDINNLSQILGVLLQAGYSF